MQIFGVLAFSASRRSKTAQEPRRAQEPKNQEPRAQEAPKTAPRRPKRAPRPKTAQEASKTAQEAPKTAPRGGPDGGPERRFRALGLKPQASSSPQDAPRGPQEAPKEAPTRPQEAPHTPQDGPKRPPRGFQSAAMRPPRDLPRDPTETSDASELQTRHGGGIGRRPLDTLCMTFVIWYLVCASHICINVYVCMHAPNVCLCVSDYVDVRSERGDLRRSGAMGPPSSTWRSPRSGERSISQDSFWAGSASTGSGRTTSSAWARPTSSPSLSEMPNALRSAFAGSADGSCSWSAVY